MNGPEDAVFRELLKALPRSGGTDRWDLADPYMRRHAVEHAARVGWPALMRLFSDGEFLINAEPRSILAALPPFRDELPGLTRRLLDVYCASLSWHQHVDIGARRQILALDARRLGHGDLAERIEISPGGRQPTWRCVWSTAENVSSSAGATMSGHGGGINAILVAGLVGTAVAITASADRTARIWDLRTGQARHVLLHTAPVDAVAVASVESRSIVLTGSDRLVWWDPQSGEPLGVLDTGSTVRQLAPAADGRVVLATGGGPVVVDLPRETRGVRAITVTAAGRQARYVAACRERDTRFGLSVTEGNAVSAFTLSDGAVLHRGVLRTADRITAQFVGDVGDQSIALFGHASGACTVVHAHTGTVLHTLHSPGATRLRGAVAALTVHASRDHWCAIVGHRDGTLRTWNLGSGELLRTTQAHAASITVITTHTVGGRRVLLTASEDDTVRTWDAETGEPRDVLAGHTSDVTATAAADVESRSIAVTGSKDCTVRTWDLRRERPSGAAEGHGNWVRAVALHREDGLLRAVTTCSDPYVRIFDAGTGRSLARLAVPERDFLQACAVFTHAQGAKIVAGGAGGVLAMWDYATRRQDVTLRMGSASINAVAVHAAADGRIRVIVGANDGTVARWEPYTGRRPDRLLVPSSREESVACLAIADGAHGPVVVTGHFDGGYRVVSLEDGRPLQRRSHSAAVKAVAAGEIDSMPSTATGDDTGLIRLRGLDDGVILRTLRGHRDAVRSLVFGELAGHQVLFSGSRDGTVRIWDPASGDQIDRIDLPDFVQTVAHEDGTLVVGYGREVSVFTTNQQQPPAPRGSD
ncbi:WD40 repeat domain-containing protein [Streptomyces sp. NPDC002405]|uniref:WD40 repeat domain-containing protein n=1 Tax=Streptomyces sp. NPDC001231 TaxID=3364549 RepID=UPI0036B2AD67